MHEAARKERNERFCRYCLTAIYEALRNERRVSGDTVVDTANSVLSFDQKVEDKNEALQLLRKLKVLGLITETPMGTRNRGASPRLGDYAYELTERGMLLVCGDIPPVPGVWDQRMVEP